MAIFVLAFAQCAQASEFALFGGAEAARIMVAPSEEGYVKLAAEDLAGDVKKVGGVEIKVEEGAQISKTPALYIGTISNPHFRKLLTELGVDAKSLDGKFECYRLANVGKNSFAVIGSEPRATMFGVYELCQKYLGVDPLYYFSGIEPQRKGELTFKDFSYESKEPTTKYRGWFINDEDLLTGFFPNEGKRYINYLYYDRVISAKLMRNVIEALVRARYNLMIPSSFMNVMNAPEENVLKEAVRRGVYISTHHVEPLGVNGYTFYHYWELKGKKREDAQYSYFSNKDGLIEAWRHYAQKWAQYPDVIWQIGLRGVGDRPMWFYDNKIADSDAERGRIISEAIAKQIEIVKEFDKRPNPPMTTTLWAEGATLYKHGYIKIPEGVTIVFADNCPGWKMQEDFYTVGREPKRDYGIYYHHQLWGAGPHLISGIPPSQTRKVLAEANEKRSASYVILNVGNVREFVVGIDTSAKMLLDFPSVAEDGGLSAYMEEFFADGAKKLVEIYTRYYACFQIQKTRNVPMWLDGHLRGEINANIRKVYIAANNKKSMNEFLKDEKEKAGRAGEIKDKEMNRFVKDILGDAHPDTGTFAERTASTQAQYEKFSAVLESAENLAFEMPTRERKFLRENLIPQTYIMTGISLAGNCSVRARVALAGGDADECLYNLKRAKFALVYPRRGMELASGGKWAGWFENEDKVNFKKMEEKLDETIARIEKRNF